MRHEIAWLAAFDRLHVLLKGIAAGILSVASVTVLPVVQAAPSHLENPLQQELTTNPSLKAEGLAVRVVGEQNGSVTLEVYKGSRELREAIHRGLDVTAPPASLIGNINTEDGLRALKALRKAVDYVRKMKGGKKVLVKAAVDTAADRSQTGPYWFSTE